MDKIFSARVDEVIIQRITALAQRLGISKKAVVEGAIRLYAETVENTDKTDVFGQTQGAWQRQESPADTVRQSRQAFRASMERHC